MVLEVPAATPPASPAAGILLGVAGLSVVAGLAGAVLLPASRAGDLATRGTVAAFLLGMALLAVVGFLLVRRRGQRRIGLLLLAVGALGAAGRAVIGVALAEPTGTPDALAWATNWAWVPGAGAVLLLLLRFPTGELPSDRWRWVERAALAWTAATLLVTAVVPGDLAVSPLSRRNPVGIESAEWLAALLGPAFLVLPALTVLAAAAPVARFRRADGVQRQQLRWVAAAVVVLALAAPLAAGGSAGGAVVEGLAYLLVPVAVVVAVLRYRLWDLGLVVRRGLVYVVASAALLSAHVGTVTLTAPLLSGRMPEALATAVVAVSAVPFLAGAQRAVERLLFGERRDPDRAVRSLAQRLAATPEALLPQVVEEVARSLRLPYVAVELADGTVGAGAGAPVAAAVRVPLRHRGATVGWLVAAPRSPGETLDGRDLHLLRQVADHAGLAVHSTLLAAELRTAADRLRTARAEERARLRADLHDELGPALGAISMRAEAARNLLSGGELRRADDVLGSIERGTEAAVAEVRRILAALQPRVLEEDGLEAALRAVAAAVPEEIGVRLDLDLLSVLPPRVELAAYRVAAEAVRNAVRHSEAGAVTIALRGRGGGVELEVRDDGIGLPADHRPGVGLRSMHARAAELGGSLHVAAEPTGGTAVRLVLPVGAP